MPLLNVQVRRVKYEKGLARKHKLATKFDFPLEIQFEEDLDILTDDDLEEYIAEQIEALSNRITLHPGDLVLTGTPSGVGMARKIFLKPGDHLRSDMLTGLNRGSTFHRVMSIIIN